MVNTEGDRQAMVREVRAAPPTSEDLLGERAERELIEIARSDLSHFSVNHRLDQLIWVSSLLLRDKII
jgi:hypothetical protein